MLEQYYADNLIFLKLMQRYIELFKISQLPEGNIKTVKHFFSSSLYFNLYMLVAQGME